MNIPSGLVRRKDVSVEAKFVYGALFSCYENVMWDVDKSFKRPSVSDLVYMTGCTAEEVRSALRELYAIWHLEIVDFGDGSEGDEDPVAPLPFVPAYPADFPQTVCGEYAAPGIIKLEVPVEEAS